MDQHKENISRHNFEQCLKCTVCTDACPVTLVNPAYPGPKQAGPDGERFRLKNPALFDETLKYCLNCKQCEVACPSGVRIGDLILGARLAQAKSRPSLRDTILAETDAVGTLAAMCAPIVNASLAAKPVKFLMDRTLKIDLHRQFPKYASTKFETWYRRNALKRQPVYSRQISYFHGCYVNYNYPLLGIALVELCNALGIGVRLLERERCCGVAKIANGLVKKATRDAEINLGAIRRAVGDGSEAVVATSSTCCFTMRDEYGHILGLDNTDVRGSITLATAYLSKLIERGEVRLIFCDDYRPRIAYHTPCHLERMGFTAYSVGLLKTIPGAAVTVLDRNCCGIAGTYGFKKENYATSQAIGSKLFADIERERPDFVVTDCETCKWQIEMSTGVKVMHPVEVLRDALDLEATAKANNLTN